jgi:hypothetical protein
MNTPRRILWMMVALLLLAAFSSAQDSKRQAQLRTVRGFVSDKSDTPMPGSVIFLKNLRTNAVQSHIADEDGNYRFSGLDPNADYEVYAQKDDAKSQTRTVSSFDGRKDIILNLKIDKKKN